jgi:hypothetical protein
MQVGMPVEQIPDRLEWQVTAKTVRCPIVGARVTLIVKSDWTSYCTWYEDNKDKDHFRGLGHCETTSCSHVSDYRNALIQEEIGQLGEGGRD